VAEPRDTNAVMTVNEKKNAVAVIGCASLWSHTNAGNTPNFVTIAVGAVRSCAAIATSS